MPSRRGSNEQTVGEGPSLCRGRGVLLYPRWAVGTLEVVLGGYQHAASASGALSAPALWSPGSL